MRKLFVFFICIALATACKKEDNNPNSNNNNNNTSNQADNTFKVIKGDGSGEQTVTLSSAPTCGTENSQQGTFYSVRGFFNVGSHSTYDRLAVGFKSEPAAAGYPVTFQQYYANLPADKAGVNITYDGWNYVVTTGSVTVSVTNGKRKVTFDNLVLENGASLGAGGAKLPDGSKITGAMVCN